MQLAKAVSSTGGWCRREALYIQCRQYRIVAILASAPKCQAFVRPHDTGLHMTCKCKIFFDRTPLD